MIKMIRDWFLSLIKPHEPLTHEEIAKRFDA